MAQDTLQQAISAFKAGRKDEARTLFMDVVEQDQHNEQAWLYLSALVDTLEEQQICLENVLTVNPNHEKAKQGLATVQQKLAEQEGTTSPPADQAPTPPAFDGSSAPIGAEFAGTSGDSLFGSSDSSAFDSGFGDNFDFGAASGGFEADEVDAGAPAGTNSDPFSWMADTSAETSAPDQSASDSFGEPSTSVDWGNDDQPAVYGSGRQVEEPDYDNWMDNLPIGTNVPPADSSAGSAFGDTTNPSPFGDSFNDATPFGDASYMVDDEAMAADSPFGGFATDDSPWDTPSTAASGQPDFGLGSDSLFDDDEDPFGDLDTAFSIADPFDAEDEPSGDAAFADSSAFGTFDFGDETESSLFADDSDSGFDFSFDDEPASKTSAAAKQAAKYYKHIPGEIEPMSGGFTRHSAMLLGGIVIMIALNVASFFLLM